MNSTWGLLTEGDDSGASTFARFRYQSKLTLLHWLRTLLETGPKVVHAEHIEDLVLDYGDNQVFVQIKSRSSSRPLWRASEMCDSGGGIDSLARAYAIAHSTSCSFELHLEGGTSPSGETKRFVNDCGDASDNLKEKIEARLKEAGVPPSELGPFLKRLRIRPRQPDQSSVDSQCASALIRLAPGLTGQEIVQLGEKLLLIVESAQEAKHPGLSSDAEPHEFLLAHLSIILGLETAKDDPTVAGAKALTAERLEQLLPEKPSTESLLLLHRATDSASDGITAMERKLIAAGASETVVIGAKALRAMSEIRRIELQAGSDHLALRLEDLQNRVLTHAQAVALGFVGSSAPANGIWNALITSVGLENTDQFDLFQRDRQALVGLLCCVSDECQFAWAPS